MQKSYTIVITGQVQGVGFRPHVFNMATQYDLLGTVSNNEEGVLIQITGNEEDCRKFYQHLILNPPPVSKIEHHTLTEIPAQKFEDFQILPSVTAKAINLRLTPDFAICNACKAEIADPHNRRYQYPFTTCINCGPRWAITGKFPFDRENTSLEKFSMCLDCAEEYSNPQNRRFHSQTNSCETCGIQVSLWDNRKNHLSSEASEIFPEIRRLLKNGKILALKNTSGFLLCCDAENPAVVQRLRNLKKRPQKPFAVLYPSLEILLSEISLSEEQLKAFSSSERPIVILPLKEYSGKVAIDQVAPGLNQLGVMLPYTGLLQMLGQQLEFPVVATSGNIHGSPVISNSEASFEKLGAVADYFLLHNLEILHAQDDSVLKLSEAHQVPVLFRRSRGYAPNIFITPKRQVDAVLAMGADLKSAIAFLPNEQLYISQYFGNLENYEVYERLTQETRAFIDLFQKQPTLILVDKHPRYLSTGFGRELGKRLGIPVHSIQHHKAHFASVLGEHSLFDSQEKILGVIWDGVGYGDDEQVWGGEFFNYQAGAITRIGHLEYFDWLAGDKMSKEPRLSLFSLCEDSTQVAYKFSEEELAIYSKLKVSNHLKTSSVGRLFDAVASLLDLCDKNTYEGEASILLENYVDSYDISACTHYSPTIFNNFIPAKAIIAAIQNELRHNVPKKTIAANFIFTMASLIIQFAKQKGYRKLGCSGGVFQNTTLVDMIMDLNTERLDIYFNREVSPNDENISFGQIMYYLNCKEA